MIREQIEFLRCPPDDVWEAMCGWLRHHGINPARVPTLWLDRCEHTRRIHYPELLIGVDVGQLSPPAAVVELVPRCHQLESPPSPFPQFGKAAFNYLCAADAKFASALPVPPVWPQVTGATAVRVYAHPSSVELRWSDPGSGRG